MTDLYQCPDCGRQYRADKLSTCPGCGDNNDKGSASNIDGWSREAWANEDGFEPLSKIRAARKNALFTNESILSTLFTDRHFRKFITKTWAGNIYIIGAWLIALAGVVGFLALLFTGLQDTRNFFYWIVSLLLTPVLTFSAVVIWRVTVEIFVSVIVIAENTTPTDD